jgi:hypothetical protein
MIRPLICADRSRVAAFIIGAVDQDAVEAGFPHLSEIIFCWRVVSGMPHDSADRALREAATAWNFAGRVQKARAQPNLLRAQCQHTFYAYRFPVPKTLRKRGLRNPTTAAFCLRENGCSEYTGLRNTLRSAICL